MKRFMSFASILELVEQQLLPLNTVIKRVNDGTNLLLKEVTLSDDGSKHYCFFSEDRLLIQGIDPVSVWELINIEVEEVQNESTIGPN